MATTKAVRIDQWWDRTGRFWTVAAIDTATGYQIGDAIFDGTRHDSDVSKRYMKGRVHAGAIKPIDPTEDDGIERNERGAIVIRTR
jgi:hypothetical protein